MQEINGNYLIKKWIYGEIFWMKTLAKMSGNKKKEINVYCSYFHV